MDPDSFMMLKKVVIDVICLSLVAIPILIFKLFGVPYHRGFYCDDETIRYPYKDSTVTNVVLYIVGLCLPVLTIMCVELIRYSHDRSREAPVNFCGKSIPCWLQYCYKCIGIFGFGAACSQTITDIGKYSIGRLRPHFMSVCIPDVDCKNPENLYRYIVDFKCLGEDYKKLHDSRLSFPSGHSSFSMYAMLFIILYLQKRFEWKGSFLLKHVLQFLCLLMAWATALSRVSDYKHHWSDVLSGLVIGTIVALLTQPFLSRVFKKRGKTSYVEANNGTSLPTMTDNHHS